MLLKEVCTTDVVCCGVQTTGLEAARLTRQRHVGDMVMRTPVVIAHESEDTATVLERMRAHGVRRLPVVGSAGSTVGIITLDDMLRLLVVEAGELLETMAKAERREQHARR